MPSEQPLRLVLSKARAICAALSATRRGRLVLLASLLALALGGSAYLGSAHSPDYATREAAMGYMIRHVSVVGNDKRCGLTLRMDAAGERYTFCTKSGKLETHALTSAYDDPPRFSLTKEDIEAGKTFVKEILVPLGSAAISESAIARWVRFANGFRTAALTVPQQRLFNGVAAFVVASGAYIGGRHGYSEDKRFNNLMVLEALKDPTVWSGIADIWVARSNLDVAQGNIRAALQADPEALFALFHIRGREIRLSELQSEVDRQSAEVNKLLGRTQPVPERVTS